MQILSDRCMYVCINQEWLEKSLALSNIENRSEWDMIRLKLWAIIYLASFCLSKRCDSDSSPGYCMCAISCNCTRCCCFSPFKKKARETKVKHFSLLSLCLHLSLNSGSGDGEFVGWQGTDYSNSVFSFHSCCFVCL